MLVKQIILSFFAMTHLTQSHLFYSLADGVNTKQHDKMKKAYSFKFSGIQYQ